MILETWLALTFASVEEYKNASSNILSWEFSTCTQLISILKINLDLHEMSSSVPASLYILEEHG